MRLWSLHPEYLDTKGLVAVWREGLLAFHVVAGKTKGYVNHPQLIRFKSHNQPLEAISSYLHVVADEAETRGYSFKREKLPSLIEVPHITVTTGQLTFEAQHLLHKLALRDQERHKLFRQLVEFKAHPLFKTTKGEIETWEKIMKAAKSI